MGTKKRIGFIMGSRKNKKIRLFFVGGGIPHLHQCVSGFTKA